MSMKAASAIALCFTAFSMCVTNSAVQFQWTHLVGWQSGFNVRGTMSYLPSFQSTSFSIVFKSEGRYALDSVYVVFPGLGIMSG